MFQNLFPLVNFLWIAHSIQSAYMPLTVSFDCVLPHLDTNSLILCPLFLLLLQDTWSHLTWTPIKTNYSNFCPLHTCNQPTCICTCRYVHIIHTKSKLYLLLTKVKNGTTNLCYNPINDLSVLTRQLIPSSLESSCLLFVETVSLHYIAHAGLIVMILLPQHPKCWDYRYEPLSPAEFSF